MRFARVGEKGRERPVVHYDGAWWELGAITDDVDGGFLFDATSAVETAHASGLLTPADIDGERVGAPIARPSAIYCIGMNYAAHARESGSEPPTVPVLFMKAPNTVTGPDDAVPIPRGSSETDWEVELAVVIGARASYLESTDAAASVIAGYTIANDLSEREWQLRLSGGQWGKGKSAPDFSPLGPWLVTPDEVSPDDLRLRSWVNGEPRQDSRTSDLIFDVPFIVWHLSQFLVLEPGDLILTGTPEGVGLSGRFPYLRAGDVVELEIEGLGRQRQVMT